VGLCRWRQAKPTRGSTGCSPSLKYRKEGLKTSQSAKECLPWPARLKGGTFFFMKAILIDPWERSLETVTNRHRIIAALKKQNQITLFWIFLGFLLLDLIAVVIYCLF
jgi:hypothetical protein